jgi:hypothetical protein
MPTLDVSFEPSLNLSLTSMILLMLLSLMMILEIHQKDPWKTKKSNNNG